MSPDSLCRFIARVKSVQWKRADLTRPQLEREREDNNQLKPSTFFGLSIENNN